MILEDIHSMVNRALYYSVNIYKLITTAVTLGLCGLFFVFCWGMYSQVSHWVASALIFMPCLLCMAILLPLGALITRIYHLEVKNQPFEILGLVKKSWQIVVGATYFSIPFILGYLLLWMLLGLFLLLASIPYFGMVFAVVLSFVPYLIQLAALVIVGVSLGMLFFFTPLMALTGIQRIEILQLLGRRFRIDPFLNICLFLLGLLPFIVTSILLSGAYYLTLPLLELGFDSTFHSLQMGVMLFPCALLLTPSVVFFFNFGAESHALMHRLMRATEMEG